MGSSARGQPYRAEHYLQALANDKVTKSANVSFPMVRLRCIDDHPRDTFDANSSLYPTYSCWIALPPHHLVTQAFPSICLPRV
ncbi:hypothetical protein ALP20_200018 [Pseudomonas coronafaciens pv. coronafaciens]|nr:hypothetical protein ALP20_200018 [Pseudomonas coronafaciens pv. coronafaciens]